MSSNMICVDNFALRVTIQTRLQELSKDALRNGVTDARD